METIEQIADKYVLELDSAQYTETTIKDAFLAGYDYGRKDIILTDKKPEEITIAELEIIKKKVEDYIANMLYSFKKATKINDFDINVSRYKFEIYDSLSVKIEAKIK